MYIQKISFAVILLFTIVACSAPKASQNYSTLGQAAEQVKTKDNVYFIVNNSGDTIIATKYKYLREGTGIGTSMNANEALFKIDGKKYWESEVAAYQDANSFHKKYFYTYTNTSLGITSKEKQSYYWVEQLKRGKINLYYYTQVTYEGQYGNRTIIRFLIEKGKDKLYKPTMEGFESELGDNPEAKNKFTTAYKNLDEIAAHPQALLDAIDIYNKKN